MARPRPRRERTIERTKAFDRDLKRLAKQSKDLGLLGLVISGSGLANPSRHTIATTHWVAI